MNKKLTLTDLIEKLQSYDLGEYGDNAIMIETDDLSYATEVRLITGFDGKETLVIK